MSFFAVPSVCIRCDLTRCVSVYRCTGVGDDSSAQWMVALVRETLHGKREGDEVQGQAKARRLVRAHCL